MSWFVGGRRPQKRETQGLRRAVLRRPESVKHAASKIWEGGSAALTEQRNPRSENLEKLSARQLVELFIEEEKFVQEALRGAIDDLIKAIEIATASLRKDGRLIYVGAGTSGRLGVLDASE